MCKELPEIEDTCRCQDSKGAVCGKPMTPEEWACDGMCDACACNVWAEMNGDNDGWEHKV